MLGTPGLEEHSSRASYASPIQLKKVAQAQCFPSPSLATEGNLGRLILPYDRTGVLLTPPGQLTVLTRRPDQEPTDNKAIWENSPSLQGTQEVLFIPAAWRLLSLCWRH